MTMQLAVIDDQIERVKGLLTKYNYSSQEKELKLAYLRGYVTACHEAAIISPNEFKAFMLAIEAL